MIFTRPTGEKQTRAGGFSSQCEARNAWIVRGAWNDPFLDVLEAFPDGQTDDDVDAASDAFNALAAAPPIFLPDTLPTLADRGF